MFLSDYRKWGPSYQINQKITKLKQMDCCDFYAAAVVVKLKFLLVKMKNNMKL